MYETRRRSNPNLLSDVYDAPRWERVMGHATICLSRISLQLCWDGFLAFQQGVDCSLKPLEFMILSLPPHLRVKARHMLLLMLIPSSLKAKESRKYLDWAADFEINDLHIHGIDGVRVIVYATSLDSPGRAELLCMQNHGAIYGCPYCQIAFDPGLTTKPVFASYRRFLPLRHPWRQRRFVVDGYEYQFSNVERRLPPEPRSVTSTLEGVGLATASKPFRGHKEAPLLSRWASFSWDMNPSDVMHDLKSVCQMLLKILVGKGSHGMYEHWNRDGQHRAFCRVMDIFPQVHDERNPLPWRLSREAVSILNSRVAKIWWPHYMDILCKNGYSFFKKSHVMWKARHKSLILMVILPTCLRGYVPAVHRALLTLIYALRQLEGQVISKSEAERLNVVPGSVILDRKILNRLHLEVIKGLVMLEGSLPPCHLNPLLHRLVHYVEQTALFGCLLWFAMYAFERYNKLIKGLVKNRKHPMASIATNIKTEIASRYLDMTTEVEDKDTRTCVLVGKSKIYKFVLTLYV